MNRNNIHFQVHRTKEGTLIELISGLLVLLSLILSIVLFIKVREAGGAMLLQTGTLGFVVLLMLFLAYKPETFNIPDDSPAEFIYCYGQVFTLRSRAHVTHVARHDAECLPQLQPYGDDGRFRTAPGAAAVLVFLCYY